MFTDGGGYKPVSAFNRDEKHYLLALARESIKTALLQEHPKHLDKATIPPILQKDLACFVTLTIHERLRGCIGSLEAFRPLVEDVRDRAVQAALEDYRFPPLQPNELDKVDIEISVLTRPEKLYYNSPEELPAKLRPHIDGVILRDGSLRATFLPQVWEQIPNPEDFLNHLCTKMGAKANHWRTKMLDVEIYQVDEFSDSRSS